MTIERYRRSARRYRTAVYVVTLLLLATGWWLLTGREGQPSPLAVATGIPDSRLHVWLGWALVVVPWFRSLCDPGRRPVPPRDLPP